MKKVSAVVAASFQSRSRWLERCRSLAGLGWAGLMDGSFAARDFSSRFVRYEMRYMMEGE